MSGASVKLRQYIPIILRTIADELGVEAAIKFADELGGQRICVPQKAKGSVLEKRVGIELAEILVREYTNDRLYIPNWGNRKTVANKAIILENPDATVNELVRLTGLCDRQIYRLKASLKDEI